MFEKKMIKITTGLKTDRSFHHNDYRITFSSIIDSRTIMEHSVTLLQKKLFQPLILS